MSPRSTRWCRVVAALAAAVMLGGCIVTPLGRQRDLASIVAADRHRVAADLAVPQTRGVAGCGAQALGGAIGRVRGTDPQAAADALPWHDRGATPVDLFLAARAAGCAAELRAGTWADLERLVACRETGIVMIDAAPEVRTLFSRFQTSPVMHWALVAGVARDGSEVLIALPEDRVAVVDRAWFLDRWSRSDHCLIVIAAQREAMRNTSADARSINAR